MSNSSETSVTSDCPRLIPVQQQWLQMPGPEGYWTLRSNGSAEISRGWSPGPWVGRGALVPSNPPRARFPRSVEGTQGAGPGWLPPDHLVTRARKGAESGPQSAKRLGRWSAGCCTEGA